MVSKNCHLQNTAYSFMVKAINIVLFQEPKLVPSKGLDTRSKPGWSEGWRNKASARSSGERVTSWAATAMIRITIKKENQNRETNLWTPKRIRWRKLSQKTKEERQKHNGKLDQVDQTKFRKQNSEDQCFDTMLRFTGIQFVWENENEEKLLIMNIAIELNESPSTSLARLYIHLSTSLRKANKQINEN